MLFTMADVEIGNTHIQIYHNRFPTEIHFEYAKVTIKMEKATQQQQKKKKQIHSLTLTSQTTPYWTT